MRGYAQNNAYFWRGLASRNPIQALELSWRKRWHVGPSGIYWDLLGFNSSVPAAIPIFRGTVTPRPAHERQRQSRQLRSGQK